MHVDDPGEDITYVVLGATVTHISVGGLTLCGQDSYAMDHTHPGSMKPCSKCERSAAKRWP